MIFCDEFMGKPLFENYLSPNAERPMVLDRKQGSWAEPQQGRGGGKAPPTQNITKYAV